MSRGHPSGQIGLLTFASFSSPEPLNLRNWPKCLKPLPIGYLGNALETLGGRKSKIRITGSLEDIREDRSPHLLFRAFVMSWHRTVNMSVIRPEFCCFWIIDTSYYMYIDNYGALGGYARAYYCFV